jgi:hypothetical protein
MTPREITVGQAVIATGIHQLLPFLARIQMNRANRN